MTKHHSGVAAPAESEPVAWTVAGEVTNWARDFSKYRTQHYVRPVYVHPAPTSGVRVPALPFDTEYVRAYLEEVLTAATGNADPEVQKLLAWLADGVGGTDGR